MTTTGDRRSTRDELLDAAVDLLLTRGVHACTTRAVAAQAGVSNGAVHYHFRDVNEILDLAMIRATDVWIAWLSEVAASAATSADAFWSVIAACREPFATGDRSMLPLWLEYWAVCTRAGRHEPVAHLHQRLVDHVADLLVAVGHSRREATEQARAVNAYLFGIALHDSIGVTPLATVQRQLSALCGLAPP